MKKVTPDFIIVISMLQILAFYFGGVYGWLYLVYNPCRRHEVWRLITTIFVHVSDDHLWGNIPFQLLFGILLETVHRWNRIGIIYLGGVLGGSMLVTIFVPTGLIPDQFGSGASSGVYALVFAYVVNLVLNWNKLNKKCRLFGILVCILFGYFTLLGEPALENDPNVTVDNLGHFGGALSGLLISVLVLKNLNSKKHPWIRTIQNVCAAILIALAFTTIIVNIGFSSMYVQSEFNRNYQEDLFTMIDMSSNISESQPPFLIVCLQDRWCADEWAEYSSNYSLNDTLVH